MREASVGPCWWGARKVARGGDVYAVRRGIATVAWMDVGFRLGEGEVSEREVLGLGWA